MATGTELALPIITMKTGMDSNETAVAQAAVNVGIGEMILSDGSRVYSVGVTDPESRYVSFDCISKHHGLELQFEIVAALRKAMP